MIHTITHVKNQSIANVKNWEQILSDAQAALMQAQTRARALRRVIRTIQTNIANGKPFPIGNEERSNDL